MSLRRLSVERIDLYYLHRIDPRFSLADQLEVLTSARDAGKIRHIGISKVTVDEIKRACELTPIAVIQNKWNIHEGDADAFAY
jgi:aryl-alcohol dehydrogenase-like predicted oxidoreductase